MAVIVAMDAAGYSHQSEVDEATAIREITALGERIRASAAARHGRVFNTAGDGFMLEFPSAAAALEAAEEVQSIQRVPLRIGVHIGEVSETPSGDLLGKGVNIAARLMALAAPGAAVVSGDVKRALPDDVAARLIARGVVRLDKMSERVETFELGSPWRKPGFALPRWAPAFGVGIAVSALFLLGLFGVRALLPRGSQAIAVLEFRAFDAPLQTFASGLADRIIGTMSSHELQATQTSITDSQDRIAAAARSGAAFVLDGSVRPEGENLLVNARLVDTRGNVALWSGEYTRTAAEQSSFQEEIAADVARVLRCALVTSRPSAGDIDPATLALFMRACDGMNRIWDNTEAIYPTLQQVTERAPRFSRGWSARAMAAAALTGWRPNDGQELIAEAREAIARARRLDPTNGETYLVEFWLLPERDWRARQALLDRALDVAPDLAALHAAQAELFMAVGRHRDALASMRRAIALEPLNSDYWSMQAPALRTVGANAEADALLDRLYRIWPKVPESWWIRFLNSSYAGDPARALSMLDEMDTAPVRLERDAAMRWRAFLLARQSRDRARLRAAAYALQDLPPGQLSPGSMSSVLSMAGEIDAAYEIMERILRDGYGTGPLFNPPWANARRDRRFMTLVSETDTGLIQYWRETGRWPDFCRERDLPYNCEAEAARVLPP